MSKLDLTEVIEDAISDADLPADPDADSPSEAPEAPETVAEDAKAPEPTAEPAKAPEAAQAASEAKADTDPASEEDDFDKKYGLPKPKPGQNNRIPYDRVRKIVEKHGKDTAAKVEAKWLPKVTEYEAKVKDYEQRLERVGEFEQVMYNQPDRFFEALSNIPAYKEFFQYVAQLDGFYRQYAQAAQKQAAGAQVDDDPMPKPKPGADGYDEEDLQKLLDWNSRRTEKQVTARFAPIESEWKRAKAAEQHLAQLRPQIQQQIDEASKWPNFPELEPQIIEILDKNPRVTLEGAYRQAYQSTIVPRMAADREALYQQVLSEVKKAPPKISPAPSRSGRVPEAPRELSTEEIIIEQMKAKGLL